MKSVSELFEEMVAAREAAWKADSDYVELERTRGDVEDRVYAMSDIDQRKYLIDEFKRELNKLLDKAWEAKREETRAVDRMHRASAIEHGQQIRDLQWCVERLIEVIESK